MNFIKDMFDLTFSRFITVTIAKYLLLLFWALDILIGIIAVFAIFPFGILVYNDFMNQSNSSRQNKFY